MRVSSDSRPWFVAVLTAAICGCLLVGAGGAAAARGGGVPFVRTDGAPTGVAFSHDSSLVAVPLNWSNSIGVYSTAGGSPDAVPGSPFHAGTEPVSVNFSPDGDLLAVASKRADQIAVYRVAANGSLARAPESPVDGIDGAKQVEFTPNGKVLVALGDGTLYFYAVAGDGRLTPLSGSPVGGGGQAFAISPDGKVIAAAGGDTLNVYAFSVFAGSVTMKLLPGAPGWTGDTGADRADDVAFNRAGSLIAVASGKPRSVSTFALLTDLSQPTKVEGSPFENWGENEPHVCCRQSSIAFSADGSRLLATNFGWPEIGGNYSAATLFSVGDGFYTLGRLTKGETFPLDAELGPALGAWIAFSPDGRLFASTSSYRASTSGSLTLEPTKALRRTGKGR
jgi:hypothetical protein